MRRDIVLCGAGRLHIESIEKSPFPLPFLYCLFLFSSVANVLSWVMEEFARALALETGKSIPCWA